MKRVLRNSVETDCRQSVNNQSVIEIEVTKEVNRPLRIFLKHCVWGKVNDILALSKSEERGNEPRVFTSTVYSNFQRMYLGHIVYINDRSLEFRTGMNVLVTKTEVPFIQCRKSRISEWKVHRRGESFAVFKTGPTYHYYGDSIKLNTVIYKKLK